MENTIKVELKSVNDRFYPSIKKTIVFTIRDDKVLISTEDGKEIANIVVNIMDKEVKDGDKWDIAPSNSYWVVFNPISSQTHPSCADVFVDGE